MLQIRNKRTRILSLSFLSLHSFKGNKDRIKPRTSAGETKELPGSSLALEGSFSSFSSADRDKQAVDRDFAAELIRGGSNSLSLSARNALGDHDRQSSVHVDEENVEMKLSAHILGLVKKDWTKAALLSQTRIK